MNAYEYDDVSHMYRDIVRLLAREKSDHGTKELTDVMLKINNLDETVITDRNISLQYLCGELLWYMAGSNDVNFISKFAKKWSEITDDGETSNSAYGDIICYRHGFNQLEKIISLLKKDEHSRRAVINFNVPNENVIETKDEICTIALQFLLRDNRVHCTAIMRSNDVYTGMPYDIAFFTSLQKFVAHALNKECGTYTHIVTSLHLYEQNESKLISELGKRFPKVKLNALKLLELTFDDYDDISNSSVPREDVVKLFVNKGIIEISEII